MKRLFCTIVLLIVASAFGPFASAQSHAELQTMVQQLQTNPSDTALRERIIQAARALRPVPAIPEEALRIAPWWGDAWYNLAVAQELAGQLDAARRSLQLYILTGLDAEEARKVQDRIYALEAKNELASTEAATEAANAAAQQAAKQAADQQEQWNGLWRYERGAYASTIRSEKTGESIRFLSVVDGQFLHEFIRGRIESSGNISWEVYRAQACRSSWIPVRVTMSADSRTLSYDSVSYDFSECRGYEIVPVVLRRQ